MHVDPTTTTIGPGGRRSVVTRLKRGEPVRLLGVWAHPDDEAYLSAGLMGRVADAGGRVACLTMTRGERGVPDDDARSPATVGRLRGAELRAALTHVGAQSLRLLGHPDGGCDAVPHAQGVAEVERAIEAVRPDVIVTFGPDGITGHPDHVAVHRWTTAAWQRVGHGELLYAAMSTDFLDRYRAVHHRVGVFGDHEPVGWSDAHLALSVDLDDRELDRKRRSLAAHASQTAILAAAMGEATYRRWWARETFRRPARAELDPALTSENVGVKWAPSGRQRVANQAM